MKRHAQPGTCPRCHAGVLTGPDDDFAAVLATVDPQPIPAADEWLALLAGRPTYTLDARGLQGVLNARTHWAIRANNERALYVAHECGQLMRSVQCASELPDATDSDVIPF